MKIYQIFTVFIFFVSFGGYCQSSAQDFDEELDSQKNKIESIKKEIERTKKRIIKEEKKEKTVARKVTILGEEIFLINRLLTEIEKEIQSIRRAITRYEREEKNIRAKITKTEEKIAKNEEELSFVRNRYANRTVYTYKRGTLSILEKLLSSTSWRQAVYRSHYLYLISEIESQIQGRLKTLLAEINKQKEGLAELLQKKVTLKSKQKSSLRRAQVLAEERERQKGVLKKKKRSKEKELKKIKENKVELTHYIEEKQVGLKELEILRKKILEDKARFERAERIRLQQELLKSKTFAEVEGLLPWPAEGKVVTKFGKHRNPELKTVTESLGIDIKGKLGSPIRSVLGGVVTTITYIRGYGTMIIIDHGGDFYTVYSHVSDIQTSIDSEIQAGDVIAYMGDSGSINGATLHFEIWGKNQKLDPEKWLVKK